MILRSASLTTWMKRWSVILSNKYGSWCIVCDNKWCISCAATPCDELEFLKCGVEKKYYTARSFCPRCGRPLTSLGEKLFVFRLKSIIGEEY